MTPITPIDITYFSQDAPVIDAPWLNLVNAFCNDAQTGADIAKGPALIPFDPMVAYGAAQTVASGMKDGYVNGLSLIATDAERAAIIAYTSVTDVTVRINAALLLGKRVYLPAGLWNVNPDVGLVLPTGGSIIGDGLMRTIIKASAVGGSVANLIAYTKGSVIKRAFTPGVSNLYVVGCYLADFSVQLNHPAWNAANYRQIGVDLRNITRSVVERVHVGNTGIPTQPICPAPSNSDACQGYGIMCGTKTAGVDYCGGEGNVIRGCLPWGLYRNIVLDDDIITPLSGAHATVVDSCDIQGGHELLVQKLVYGAGCAFVNNTLQNVIRQTGSVDSTYLFQITGYNNYGKPKYIEAGAACDFVFHFGVGSRANRVVLDNYTYLTASTGAITDGAAGGKNHLTYFAPAAITGGSASLGALTVYYDGALLQGFYKGFFSGASQTVARAAGVTVSRAGTGDYTVTWATVQPNDDWTIEIAADSGASNYGVHVCVDSTTQTTSAVRFRTYSQNGATTAAVDPRMMWLTLRQAIQV